MMESINSIRFEEPDGNTQAAQYDPRLRSLLLTREGTLPGSRGFGLTQDFLSAPPPVAINRLAVELAEKAAVYIPEVEISGVEASLSEDGKLDVRIRVEGSEEDD